MKDKIKIGIIGEAELKNVTLRKPLRKFAMNCEKVLKENDHKSGWKEMDLYKLLTRLREETDELEDALINGNYSEAKKEACDVGNFAMMIYSNIKRFKKGIDKIVI